MDEKIVRSLVDGPDYAPDWRCQVVQNYLVEVATAPSADLRLQAILDTEKDPFVRQFLRFRHDGTAVNAAAFRYAVGCQKRNAKSGVASMIKAMLVADRSPEEIAVELGTQTQNVVAFAKVFFDVRRFLGHEGWLGRVVFHEPLEGVSEVEAQKERRWLAAAFYRGWEGVQQVVFHRIPTKAQDVEALAQKLQATLASRALEFAMDLQTSGAPATEADLQRFLTARNSQGRQPHDTSAPPNSMDAFIKGIHSIVQQKAEEFPNDPKFDVIRQSKAAALAGTNRPTQRHRRRFADV